jgi:hypothetical protein
VLEMEVLMKIKKTVSIGIFALFLFSVHSFELCAMKKKRKIKERFQEGVELVCNGTNPYMIEQKVKEIKKRILEAPEKQLKLYEEQFGAKTFNCTISQDMVKKLSQKNPLFLIHGCFFGCPLSRLDNPKIRNIYEQEVVKNIKNGFIDVGPGGFLPTLRIITKFFQKNPTASLTCHAIDPFYISYIRRVQIVAKGKSFNVMTYNKRLLRESLTHFFRQIVSFVKAAFPRATFRLLIYEGWYCLKNDCLHGFVKKVPSLVVGADFDEEMKITKNERTTWHVPALQDYNSLVRFVVKKCHKKIRCVLLSKKFYFAIKQNKGNLYPHMIQVYDVHRGKKKKKIIQEYGFGKKKEHKSRGLLCRIKKLFFKKDKKK